MSSEYRFLKARLRRELPELTDAYQAIPHSMEHSILVDDDLELLEPVDSRQSGPLLARVIAAAAGLIVVVGLAAAAIGTREPASATNFASQRTSAEADSVLKVNFDSEASPVATDPTPRGCVGNRVWDDHDGDGMQERGEPSMRGVTVKLWNEDGDIVSEKVARNGYFKLCGPVGSYRITVDVPAGYRVTSANQGPSDHKDSDADESGSIRLTVDRGRQRSKYDFGLTAIETEVTTSETNNRVVTVEPEPASATADNADSNSKPAPAKRNPERASRKASIPVADKPAAAERNSKQAPTQKSEPAETKRPAEDPAPVADVPAPAVADSPAASTPAADEPAPNVRKPERTATGKMRYGLWAEQREKEMFKVSDAAFVKLTSGVGRNSFNTLEENLEIIRLAREEDVALVVMFVPASLFSNPCKTANCSGSYNHAAYKTALNDWLDADPRLLKAIREAVRDDVIEYAYVVDEPSQKKRFSNKAFKNQYIDEHAKRYKEIFPGIKTTVRQQSRQFGLNHNGETSYGRDPHVFKHLDSVIAFAHPDRVGGVRKIGGNLSGPGSGSVISNWSDAEQRKIMHEWMEEDHKIQLSNGIPETLFGIQTVTSRTHSGVAINTRRNTPGGANHILMTSPRWVKNMAQAIAERGVAKPNDTSNIILQFRYDRAPGEDSYGKPLPSEWVQDLKKGDDYPIYNPKTMRESIQQVRNVVRKHGS